MEQKPQDMGNQFSGQREYIFKQYSFNLEKRRIIFAVLLFINCPQPSPTRPISTYFFSLL